MLTLSASRVSVLRSVPLRQANVRPSVIKARGGLRCVRLAGASKRLLAPARRTNGGHRHCQIRAQSAPGVALTEDEVPAWSVKLGAVTAAMLPFACPVTTTVALAYPPAFLWCVLCDVSTHTFDG